MRSNLPLCLSWTKARSSSISFSKDDDTFATRVGSVAADIDRLIPSIYPVMFCIDENAPGGDSPQIHCTKKNTCERRISLDTLLGNSLYDNLSQGRCFQRVFSSGEFLIMCSCFLLKLVRSAFFSFALNFNITPQQHASSWI